MEKQILSSALVLLLVGGGCSGIHSRHDVSAPDVQCQSSLFGAFENEHSVRQLREEIRTQAAAGRTLPLQDESWPVGWHVEIQVRPLDGSDRVWTASPGETGQFDIKGLRSGSYCLKASASGYEGLIAPLIVDPRADSPNIELRLGLGI
jgi:hypothetical protein